MAAARFPAEAANQQDASRMATIDENNFKIQKLFNEHHYKTWEDYVTECKKHQETIGSQKVDILALLSVLCYKFTATGGTNYEKKFFDLFCQALDSESDSIYRRARPKMACRPRLFKDLPTRQVRKEFSFIWPITFEAQAQDVDVKRTYYIGIPGQYLHVPKDPKEGSGALCTMLFLIMSDAIWAFRKELEASGTSEAPKAQVDCPCLLEYFRCSSENNRNQLTALIGEYLALLNICFKLGFHETCRFQAVTQTNDFKVIKESEERSFSVKTDNRNGLLRCFAPGITDPSTQSAPKSDHSKTDDTILILNCDCTVCKLNPTISLKQEAAACSECCQRVQAPRIITELYGSVDNGEHYITSARNYFDLRFAMSMSSSEHGDFRRGEEHQKDKRAKRRKSGTDQQNFKSIREYIALFEKTAEGSNASCNSCLLWHYSRSCVV